MVAAIGAVAAVAGGAISAAGAKSAANKQANAIADANEKGTVPGWARPNVEEAMNMAQAVAKTPYQAYTGQLVAGQNQYEQGANQSISDWAKGTPQSAQMNSAYQGMVANPGAMLQSPGTDQARAGYANMASNPTMFNAGAAGTSTAYADNHLGTLSQAKATDASNPYIGQTSQGIAGVGSVAGAAGSNPYLGKTVDPITGAPKVTAGTNKMLGMNNPYLKDAIGYATDDISRAYDKSIRPMQAQRAAASGSFGNSGVEAANAEDARNYTYELGRTASGMRMQDYGLQAQLGEADVGRRLGADQFNAGNELTRQQTNASLQGQDLGRNMAGMFQQQGMGLDAAKADAANSLTRQTFNATLGQNDLTRNAGLAQQLGISNAGQRTQTDQFNTSAANTMSMGNAGIQNETNRFNVNNLNHASDTNAAATNDMNRFNSSQSMGMFGAGLAGLQSSGQFDANFRAGQQLQGLNGLGAMDQRGLQAGTALGALGQNQRGIDQQGLASAYDQWQRAQNAPLQQSQNYNAALGSLVHGSQPIIPQQGVSPVLQGLGTGMGIFSMFNQNRPATAGSGAPAGGQPGMFYDGYGWVSNNGTYGGN